MIGSKSHYIPLYLLVGGWATPLKNMLVSWDDDIPNWMESHKIPWFQTTNQWLLTIINHY